MKGYSQQMKNKNIQNVIRDYVNNKISLSTAIQISGYSQSGFHKMARKYKLYGDSAFITKCMGNTNNKRTISDDLIVKIINLKNSSRYKTTNFRDFNRYLKKEENIFISYSSLSRILNRAGIYSEMMRRKTRNKLNKEIRDAQKLAIGEKIPLSSKERMKSDIHPAKPREMYFGGVLEADACIDDFLGLGYTQALNGMIDAASSKITALYLSEQETTEAYFQVLRKTIENPKFGIPKLIKTDCRRTFWSPKKMESGDTDSKIQFQYVANILGIAVGSSTNSNYKPHIERLWLTVNNTLKTWIRVKEYKTIQEVNANMHEFVRYINDEVLTTYDDYKENVFRPYNLNSEIIFGYREIRSVGRDETISFENVKYFICDFTTPMKLKGEKVTVIKTQTGKLYATHGTGIKTLNLIPVGSKILYQKKHDLEKLIGVQKACLLISIRIPYYKINFLEYLKKFNSKKQMDEWCYKKIYTIRNVTLLLFGERRIRKEKI